MKKNILCFVQYYLPGYKSGGPVRTISNMVDVLSDEYLFKIVTTDRDVSDIDRYDGILINKWNRINSSLVYYLENNRSYFKYLYRILKYENYDLIYLNSLFDFKFSILPLIINRFLLNKKTNVLLAPRGELSDGALTIKKSKKKIYLWLSNILQLYDDVNWHASTELEKDTIKKNYKKTNNIFIAKNLPVVPNIIDFNEYVDVDNKVLKIIFLSRITPKKNLLFVLGVLKKYVKPVKLDIWGGIEDVTYWQKCEKNIEELPVNVEVCYKGPVKHDEVPNILLSYDLFFFPTLGENYGHVIAEALSAGIARTHLKQHTMA